MWAGLWGNFCDPTQERESVCMLELQEHDGRGEGEGEGGKGYVE